METPMETWMRLFKLAAQTAAVLGLFQAAQVLAADALPRRAPEYIFTLNGKETLLSRERAGKVVAVEFLLTTCPHCQKASEFMTQMYKEFGARGFLPIGIATNDPMMGQTKPVMVASFVKEFKVGFPVGFGPNETARGFMQIPDNKPMSAPQMVLIDRAGMIRWEHVGFDEKADPAAIRAKIAELLGGAKPATKAAPKAAAPAH